MMVTDLRHFLGLPVDTPGSARRLAGQLSDIVRAATAGDAGVAWETRPDVPSQSANRPCLGRMVVFRTEPAAPIRWQCSGCGDEGVISNWADSPFDLRPRRLTLAAPVNEVVISAEVAAALRELELLDVECERLVFGMRAHKYGALLPATVGDLDELIGFRGRRSQPRVQAAPTAATRHRVQCAQSSGTRPLTSLRWPCADAVAPRSA